MASMFCGRPGLVCESGHCMVMVYLLDLKKRMWW